MARMIVRDSGDSSGDIREFELEKGSMSIGRGEDAGIMLDNQTVSRNHATLTATSQGYVLEDLGSSNGTWVNGSRIDKRILRHEDRIRFGKAVAVFDEPPDPGATVLVDVKSMLDEIQGTAKIEIERRQRPSSAPDLPLPPLDENIPETPVTPPGMAAAGVEGEAPAEAPPPPPRQPRPAPPPIRRPAPARRAAVSSPRARVAQQHAGFWIRVLAWLIDAVLLACVVGGVSVGVTIVMRMTAGGPGGLQFWLVPVVSSLSALLPLLYLLVGWAKGGRTIGKAACRLRITREDGSPLGFGGAIVRLFGYLVSSLSFGVGYLMVAFTDRKRGLHDMIAGTVVVKDG
jgi:uncharacterized RDD family membrane protein YckC